MIKKKFKIPMYYSTLTVIGTNDLKKVIKKYKLDTNAVDYDAFAFRIKDEAGRYCVVFRKSHPDIIAHEVVHLVGYIFQDVNIKGDFDNDENMAYLTGWLFKKIFKTFYPKFNKK